MKLKISQAIAQRLEKHVRDAGQSEIGGVLVGERLEAETFAIADFSIQRTGGSAVHFVRDPEQHKAFIEAFFERTGRDYQRFNYIGEWHSHPSFRPTPSGQDLRTMQELVCDPESELNFALLLVVRARRGDLEVSATAFRANTQPVEVPLIAEGANQFVPGLLDRAIMKMCKLFSLSGS